MSFTSFLPGIAALLGAMGAIFAGINGFSLVHEGEQGLLKRFGVVKKKKDGTPVVLKPGFRFLIPWAYVVIKRSVTLQSVSLVQQFVTNKGLTYNVCAVVFFTIKDIYKALIGVTNLDDYVKNVAMTILYNTIVEMEKKNEDDGEELTPNSVEVNKSITQQIQALQGDWGLDISDFSVVSFSPSAESQHVLSIPIRAKVSKKALSAFFGGDEKISDHPALAAAIVGIPVSTGITG